VVPATAERPTTPTEPSEWLMHPPPDAVAHWPQVPEFVFEDLGSLPAPARLDFDESEGPVLRQISLSRLSWPRPEVGSRDASVGLAAPTPSLFEVQGGLELALSGAALSHRAQRVAPAAQEVDAKEMSRHRARHTTSSRRSRLVHAGGQAHRDRQKAAKSRTARRGPAKRFVQVRKRHA
jgi:hypothetical protein